MFGLGKERNSDIKVMPASVGMIEWLSVSVVPCSVTSVDASNKQGCYWLVLWPLVCVSVVGGECSRW